MYGWPYDELPHWVADDDDAQAEEDERWAHADRLADYTPAIVTPAP